MHDEVIEFHCIRESREVVAVVGRRRRGLLRCSEISRIFSERRLISIEDKPNEAIDLVELREVGGEHHTPLEIEEIELLLASQQLARVHEETFQQETVEVVRALDFLLVDRGGGGSRHVGDNPLNTPAIREIKHELLLAEETRTELIVKSAQTLKGAYS